MFRVPVLDSASLSYVQYFTCVTCEFVYSTHVIFLVFVGCLWFCTVMYCVCAFECNIYVGMFEEIGEFSNLWTMIWATFMMHGPLNVKPSYTD